MCVCDVTQSGESATDGTYLLAVDDGDKKTITVWDWRARRVIARTMVRNKSGFITFIHTDGHLGLSSNHVKHACDEWYTHASLLLTALTVHGCVTEDLSISTVLPISKGRNLNYSDSANYRGIALSSIFGKILRFIYSC